MLNHTSTRTNPSGRRVTQTWAIGVAVGVVAIALLATGCGKGKGTADKALVGKFTLSPVVQVADQTIPPSGGKITVGPGGGPLAGLTLEVPQGAFASARDFKVSYQPITAQTWGSDVKPVSPMINIEYGGGVADGAFLVTMPMKTAPGHVSLPYYYDDATGTIEALPVTRATADAVTFQTRHFSRWFFTDAVESLIFDMKVDTKYLPSKDQWQFPNHGSYISAGGICSGMTLSSLYYWIERRPVDGKRLTGRYDRNSDQPPTPTFWMDDSLGVRLASMVQADNKGWWDSSSSSIEWNVQQNIASDDRLTFEVIAQAIQLTKRPQMVGIYGLQKNGTWAGHSILAYRVENQTLYVADPNWHADDNRMLRLKDGKFETYYSSENSKSDALPYTYIVPGGITALVNWSATGERWKQFDGETIGSGKGEFPIFPVTIATKDADGKPQFTPLVDGMTVAMDTIEIWVGDGKTRPPGSYIELYNKDYKSLVELTGRASRVNPEWHLFPGPNVIGVYLTGTPPGKSLAEYVDFQWITINYSSIEIAAAPNPAPPGTAVAFTVTMKDAPSSARWDWNFGDGAKADNGGTSPKHTYSKEGEFTVTASVSDVSGKQPVSVSKGEITVTVRNAPTQSLREILSSVGFSGAATDRYGTCNDTTCTRIVTSANRLNTTLAIERKPGAASGYLNGLLTTAPSSTRLEYPPSPPQPLLPTPTPVGFTPTPTPTPTQFTTKATTDRAQYRGLDAAHWTLVTPGSADSMLAVAKGNLLITARVSWSCQWTQAQVAAGEATCSNPGVPSSPTALMDAVIAALAP